MTPTLALEPLPGTKRATISWTAKRIERLRRRDGDYCWICGVLMRFEIREEAIDATIDHVTPVSKGGPLGGMANMKLAHRFCNSKRGTLPWSEELAMICRSTILLKRKAGLTWLSHQHGRAIKELAS